MKKIIALFIVIGLFSGVGNAISSKANVLYENQSRDLKNISTSATLEDIQDIIDSINESDLRYYLEELVTTYPFRVTGSEACDNAGTYIYGEFNEMSNSLNVEYHNWEGYSKIWLPIPYNKHFTGKNIIATLPGTSNDPRTFVFCAQYDCNENSPGALDNGAGVAALLTVAKVLSEYDFYHAIKFIAFSGEEQGLLGSYAYAKKVYDDNEKIIGVINADTIGNNTYDTDEPHILRAYVTQPVKWIMDRMDQISNSYEIGIEIGERTYFGNSDDKSFDDYGYGAMQLFQASNNMFEDGIAGGPDDTVDIVNINYLIKVTRLIAGSLAELGMMSEIDPIITITLPEENKWYKDGEPTDQTLTKGETKIKGNITIEVTIESNYNIDKVVFELLEGENEGSGWNRQVFYTFEDISTPYSWTLGHNFSGWHTVRATAYVENDESNCDEIEIKFGSTPGSKCMKSKYLAFLERFPLFEKLFQFTFLKKIIDLQ
jgi:hypothetical protein